MKRVRGLRDIADSRDDENLTGRSVERRQLFKADAVTASKVAGHDGRSRFHGRGTRLERYLNVTDA